MAEVARVPVRALMCLRPGHLRYELELPALPPGTVRSPDGVPLGLVPLELRPLGSRFTIAFEPGAGSSRSSRRSARPSGALHLAPAARRLSRPQDIGATGAGNAIIGRELPELRGA